MDNFDSMAADELRTELRRVLAEKESKRTSSQNASLHVWLGQVADILNDGGIDMVLFLETLNGNAEIPVTKDSLKERFWKPIQKHMLNLSSTTELDTKQPDIVFTTACRVLSENFGISPPAWPSRFSQGIDDV